MILKAINDEIAARVNEILESGCLTGEQLGNMVATTNNPDFSENKNHRVNDFSFFSRLHYEEMQCFS